MKLYQLFITSRGGTVDEWLKYGYSLPPLIACRMNEYNIIAVVCLLMRKLQCNVSIVTAYYLTNYKIHKIKIRSGICSNNYLTSQPIMFDLER